MSAAGVSLVETVAVVAIATIVAGLAIPGLLRAVEVAERCELRERFDAIEAGLRSFRGDFARFPTATEGWGVMTTDSADARWRGPYVHAGDVEGLTYAVADDRVEVGSLRMPDVRLVFEGVDVRLGRRSRAREELGRLSEAAESHRTATGAFPSDVSQLAGRIGADHTVDPWGRTYRFDAALEVAFSLGADGVAASGDELYPFGFDPASVP